jgi:hypothetical protein
MTSSFSETAKPTRPQHMLTLLLVLFASVLLAQIPYVNWIFGPINTFVTAVHEMGHALVCLMTGGQVSGLTIVSDGHGHGGLTFCRAGWPFLYTQAGYLGTTFFGCLLIASARYPRLSRLMLGFIGLALATSTIFLMSGTIFQQWRILEGLGSMFWGLVLAAGFIFAAVRMNARSANIMLLFVAVQVALNAVQGVMYLMTSSFGISPGQWSDATNMQNMTGVPAFVWGFLWAAISLAMVGATLWWTWHTDSQQ